MARLTESRESERAIEAGLRILRLEPLHEGAVRQLMRLYDCSDRRGAAIELYRTLTETLRTELNAQPKAETRAVYAEITRGRDDRVSALATPQVGDKNLGAAAFFPPPGEVSRSDGGGQVAPAPRAAALSSVKSRRFGWLAGGLGAAAALALLLLTLFAPSLDPVPTGQPATVVAATPTSAIALAVLPFSNLSSDPEQEFFSDGLTEEITSALARIPDLGVVARTSAYQFKGQNRDLRAVGQSLGATHLIEGSVRKAGDQVRITAQLIQADNGLHIWTATYDRNLTDIFAIQEEIARAIAAALRMPLGLQPGQSSFASRDIDSQSHEQYLAARATMRSRSDSASRVATVELLEQVVARHPGFAPAWAALALAYVRRSIDFPRNATVPEQRRLMDELRPKAEGAARRAIELDPGLPDGYSQLGIITAGKWDFAQADELFSRALALDPLHPDTMHFYASLLSTVGRVKEAITMRERLLRLEPLVGVYNFNYVEMLWVDGQQDALNARLRARPGNSLGARAAFFARMYAAQGRYAEAADAVKTAPRDRHPDGAVEAAERLLRAAPNSTAAGSAQSLPQLGLDLDFVYVRVGAPELVMQAYEGDLASGAPNMGDFVVLWHPFYAPVRKTERFKAYVRSAGFVDYWRAKGWPALCHPTSADDFACE